MTDILLNGVKRIAEARGLRVAVIPQPSGRTRIRVYGIIPGRNGSFMSKDIDRGRRTIGMLNQWLAKPRTIAKLEILKAVGV